MPILGSKINQYNINISSNMHFFFCNNPSHVVIERLQQSYAPN